MEITNKIVRGRVFEVFIKTDFDPAEIIAVREDGTCESTNSDAMKSREDADKKREAWTLHESIQKARSQCESVAALQINRLNAEIERLKSLNAAAQAHKTIFNMSAQTVYGMSLDEIGKLKAERDGLNKDIDRLKSAYEAQRPDWQINHLKEIGELVGVMGQESVYKAVKRLKTELNACGDRLEKNITMRCEYANERDKLRVDRDALQAELERRAKCIEEQRKSIMTLFNVESVEVRTLKAERDEFKRKMNSLVGDNATLKTELALKNKWIKGARELESIRVQLAEQGIKI